jgi:integrase
MAPDRRSPGAGTVDQLPSSRWRARITLADATRRSLGTFATEAEARAVLDEALRILAEGTMAPVGGITLRAWGEKWLTERELAGDVRAIRTEWGRWRVHIATASFADLPIVGITAMMIAEWLSVLRKRVVATPYQGGRAPQHLARKTRHEILALLRMILDSAVAPAGIIAVNPAARLKIKRAKRTHEPWTYLLPAEQRALLEHDAIPEGDRAIMAVAIGSGLREGELFSLRLADLHVGGPEPFIFVRYGSLHGPPKNGKQRRVPLFGLALDAARRWLELLPAFCPRNPLGLVFPGARGAHRGRGKHLHRSRWVEKTCMKVDAFQEHLATAGIVAARRHDGRGVRWHDLRHTCASSLVAGWWGRRWRLEEVKEMLGHSSITVTQIYAHLAESALTAAADETRGGGFGGGGGVTQRSRRPQAPETTHEASELLTRRSRVRVPVDPPMISRGYASGWGPPCGGLEGVTKLLPNSASRSAAASRSAFRKWTYRCVVARCLCPAIFWTTWTGIPRRSHEVIA